MNYIAVLIGGHFDLTKLRVDNKRVYIEMMEPPKETDWRNPYIPGRDSLELTCKVLTYKLTHQTPKGVLVYEFEG